ncbi:hypothetical protein OXX69_000414 [Metschnikowia pulcherrima]
MSEETDTWQYAAAVCAVFLPPVAVYIAEGGFDTTVIINIFCTLLLWFPGVIHALYAVMTLPDGTGDGGEPAPAPGT